MLATNPTLLLQVTDDFVSSELHAIGPELVLALHPSRPGLHSLAFLGLHFNYLNTL